MAMVNSERHRATTPAKSAIPKPRMSPRNGTTSATTASGLAISASPTAMTMKPTSRRIQVIVTLAAWACWNMLSADCSPAVSISIVPPALAW